jgi:hypothetical protein
MMKDSSPAPPAPEATEDQSAVDSFPQPQSSAASDTRSRALSEILSQLNRDAEPEDSARAILPPLVAALGVDTGAVLRVVGGSEAELLAAFGHTRKRGFPYPPVDLRDACWRPHAALRTLSPAETRRALQPACARSATRLHSAFVASAFMGHAWRPSC